jgi:hypothetical protein
MKNIFGSVIGEVKAFKLPPWALKLAAFLDTLSNVLGLWKAGLFLYKLTDFQHLRTRLSTTELFINKIKKQR